ncbi:MAG: hypothetical protein ACE5H2_02465 [Terriglobia bacterium]
MWSRAEYHFDAKLLETLRRAGFECGELGDGRVQARKKRVAAIFVRAAEGKFRLAESPGYLIRGQFARLWDAGYQKFWLPAAAVTEPDPAGLRIPVVAAELQELHEVSEELRTLLGIPSFYNEALGTTCHVTAYDRLRGRGVAAKK